MSIKKTNFEKTTEGKMMKYETENKVYCSCADGHHGVVFYGTPRDRLICTNCGHWIYKDEKTKLKYEMKERGILK